MSPPWTTPLDVDRLADNAAGVGFTVVLEELTRLRAKLAGIDGSVHGEVRFSRESGFAVADVDVQGTACLICQRCLGQMTVPIHSRARVALIAAESEAGGVPEHLEPVLAAGGRITVGELVEEEVLLALPIVPLHAQAADCVPSHEVHGERGQRPFEALSELLKRE